MTATTPLREAASVILVRRRATLEVLLVRRDPSASFLPGLTAFPGGALDDDDRRDESGRRDDDDAAARTAAMRELFEETGLVAGAADHEATASAARHALLDHRPAEAAALLASCGLRWSTARARPAGRWITPAHSPIRYDTRFFLVEAERAERWPEEPTLIGHELDRVAWWRPSAALAAWGRAEHLIGPPVLVALRALARCEGDADPDLDQAARLIASARGADGRPSQRWEVVPGVFLMPFRTPTLPPATHTNAYVLGSTDGAILVEPATPYDDEQDRMIDWLDELRDEGIVVREMLVTHHHPDHVGAVTSMRRRLGLPIRAHPVTVERLRGSVTCDGEIAPDDVIELDGPSPVRVRAFFTPGHAPGHLCYFEERSGALLAGDMVASIGTILVAPGDGDMSLYLESLRAMGRLGPTAILPAHGFPVGDPQRLLEHYVTHRLMRERKVLDALEQASDRGARVAGYAELLPIAYDDTPKLVWPLASLSLQSHLMKLEQDGRAVRRADGWAFALTSSSA